MDYKYNELDYAKLIYDNGFQTTYIPTELRLVATYMRRILDYKPKKLKDELYKFSSENIPNYNKARHYKVINKAMGQAVKKGSTLIKVDDIEMYDYELEYINSLQICDENGVIPEFEYDCRKIAFTLLCQIKLNRKISLIKNGKVSQGIYFKGGNRKYNQLKKISKIPDKLGINDDIIYTLGQCNVITVMYNGLIKLNFIQELNELVENKTEKEVVIKVINFDNIGWYFDYYNKENNIKLCKYCDQPFKQTKNDIQYCSEHKQYYIPMVNKTIKCIDCGEEFEVDSKDNKTCRCEKCQKTRTKELKKERNIRYYKSKIKN